MVLKRTGATWHNARGVENPTYVREFPRFTIDPARLCALTTAALLRARKLAFCFRI